MRAALTIVAGAILFASSAFAASKPHIVNFGRWITIRWQADEAKALDVKVRALYVDGKARDFTVGPVHDVTERIFVVQRMFRLNDSLPQEPGPTRWRGEKGGWLLVDHTTGRVQQITLPEFDPGDSEVSWYRDYAAYCGIAMMGRRYLRWSCSWVAESRC
jgi:hypothetical protein